MSWYSDGVRVVDASDPTSRSRWRTSCRRPAKPGQAVDADVLSNKTQVWGVVVDEATGLIYASDMNTGLWILRRTRRDIGPITTVSVPDMPMWMVQTNG